MNSDKWEQRVRASLCKAPARLRSVIVLDQSWLGHSGRDFSESLKGLHSDVLVLHAPGRPFAFPELGLGSRNR